MSKICMHVSLLAGTDIREAVEEAKEKALVWDVAYVSFDFNGVKMSISGRAGVEKAVEDFHKCLEEDRHFVVG